MEVLWEAVRTVDLLALDDFGAQSDTAWTREKLYQPVNYRVHSGAPRPAHGEDGQLDGVGWARLPTTTTAR